MPGGRYKMGTIARMTGFSPTLLRAWERRYHLLDPQRTDGGHRLYTEHDLRVLERVRAWLDRGRSIGECAQAGRQSLLAEATRSGPSPAGGPGGSEPSLERLAGEIVSGAEAIDGRRIAEAIDQAFAIVCPIRAIDEVLAPAAVAIGEGWAEGRCSVAGEHIASGLLRSRILHLIEVVRGGAAESLPVVLACFPGENHEMGLLILAYHLARAGYDLQILGAAVPFEDLRRALDATWPRGVCLSVSRREIFDEHRPALLELAEERAGRTVFLVGGAGVPAADPQLESAGCRLVVSRGRPCAEIASAVLDAIS